MDLQQKASQHRDGILRIARRHGARNVRLFGSAARGSDRPGSDLDVLVELEPGRTLLDHVALKQDLEDLLGVPVDVVNEAALYWTLRESVLREAVPV